MSYGVISIKPTYMNKILSGDKIFEFRRTAPSKLPISLLLYSTSPVKKIVGVAYVTSIIKDKPDNLWNRCADRGGIDEADFKTYFKNQDIGCALVIDSVEEFAEPLDPSDLVPDFFAPQSFRYLNEAFSLPGSLGKTPVESSVKS